MNQYEDFRTYPFLISRIEGTGKYVGGAAYWKLYAIENITRIIIHSVLSSQIERDWWDKAVGDKIRERAESFKAQYLNKKWSTLPGGHPIYYVFLSDLNEIIRSNINLFEPLIDDINKWMTRIEQIRLPRNIVGHMNYPKANDLGLIRKLHVDLCGLIQNLREASLDIVIP